MTSTRHHNVYEDGAACFWTSSVIDSIPVLRSRTACQKLLEVLDGCRARYNVKLLGYVLMPEHLHLVVWSENASDVQAFLREFLRRGAAVITALASAASDRGNAQAREWLERFRDRARQGARTRVWKERGRAFPVTKEDGLRQKIDYIHNNPVRRRLVESPEEWEFSSARWYSTGEGAISIDDIGWS